MSLFAKELAITPKQAWQSGMSYEEMHVYFTAPSPNCECDACERGRLWERLDEEING